MDGTQIGEFVTLNAPHFTAIVGLVCNYLQEDASRKGSSHQDFIVYLHRHNHEQLVQLINNHAILQRKVDELLRKDTQEIIATLSKIEDDVAAIRSKLDLISLPQNFVQPLPELTEQALWILDVIFNKKAESLHFHPFFDGPKSALNFRGCGMGMKRPMDQRLIRDDLDILVERDFLKDEATNSKTVIYRPTGRGEKLFRSLQAEKTEKPTSS